MAIFLSEVLEGTVEDTRRLIQKKSTNRSIHYQPSIAVHQERIMFGESKKVKEESWEDFHAKHHSDRFKFSSNNERMLNSILYGTTDSQRSYASSPASLSSPTSWFGVFFGTGDEGEEDSSLGSGSSRGSRRRSSKKPKRRNSLGAQKKKTIKKQSSTDRKLTN